jgi:hypothetical protein
MTPRRAPRALLAIALLGTVAGCAGDPNDAGPAPSPAPAAPAVAPSSTASTAPSSTAATAGPSGASGSTAVPGPVALALCPTIRAWSDGTVDAVNGFRLASRTLEPADRKARYARAFVDQAALHDRLATALATMTLPVTVRSALAGALDEVAATISDGARQAATLPDSAYRYVAVADGQLLVGTEKSKAVVFNTLADLAGTAGSGVPRACGRRGALDLSPTATFPP